MSHPIDGPSTAEAVCFRHPSRPTNVRCQNCDKPICADCMRDTPVGYRCPDCATQSKPVFSDDLIVTKTLLVICLVVFVVEVLLQVSDGGAGNALTSLYGNQIFQEGALYAPFVGTGDWWRPITSGFLHGGLLHIALNSFFIYSFGQLLEPALGKARFALLYFAGMLGGSIAAMLMDPLVPSVGASGAGFGLLGAGIVMARISRDRQMASQLMIVALINFAFTFSVSGISIGGHLGGFAAGALVGFLFWGPLVRNRQLAIGVGVVVLVALFAAALAVGAANAPSGQGLFYG